MKSILRFVCAAGLLAAALPCLASFPQLTRHSPQGGQRGTEVEVRLVGARFFEPQDILWYTPGIETVSVRAEGDKNDTVVARLRIASDCTMGEHLFRLRTANGLTDIRSFQVGPYPALEEKEPNNFIEEAQPVEIGHTIEGIIKNEDVDFFRIEAMQGERVSIEMEAIRLGTAMLDGYVAVLDTNRFEVVACDDSMRFLQDPEVSFIAPYTGAYFIEVRDTSFGGGDTFSYRLHVGRHPRPLAAYPPGGQPGEELEVTWLGDVHGAFTNRVTLTGAGMQRVHAHQHDIVSPSAIPMRVMPFPWQNEIEPNNSRNAVSTNAVLSVPAAFHGIMSGEGEEDWFAFRATKGTWHVDVFGRRLGSPLDPVMNIFDASAKHLQGNDDGAGLDPYLRWEAPADGLYYIRIREHLKDSSPAAVYRVEIREVAPTLVLNFPEFEQRTQQRRSIVIPQGNRTIAHISATREGFGAALELVLPELPEGVSAEVLPFTADVNSVGVLFSAATNAPLGGVLLPITARSVGHDPEISGGLQQNVELVYGNPNNAVYYRTTVQQAALAVSRPVPFHVEVVQPSTPIVHGGFLNLPVRIQRAEGFDAPVKVRLVATPPGITAVNEITIPKGANEAIYRLSGDGRAGQTTRRMGLIAAAEEADEKTWIGSNIIDLHCEPPHVSTKLEMAVVRQGENGEMLCVIENRRPFEGEARIKLAGLPHGVTAPEMTFTNGVTEVVFPLTVDPKAARGQHKTIFCDVHIPHPGGTIQLSSGAGGIVRVDAPPPAPKTETAAAPPEPEAKPEKRLSRLEQLRQQQAKPGDGT